MTIRSMTICFEGEKRMGYHIYKTLWKLRSKRERKHFRTEKQFYEINMKVVQDNPVKTYDLMKKEHGWWQRINQIFLEYGWIRRGRLSIFVPKEIIQWLFTCSFNIDDCLIDYTPLFVLNFESGSIIEGRELRSCLCGQYQADAYGRVFGKEELLTKPFHVVCETDKRCNFYKVHESILREDNKRVLVQENWAVSDRIEAEVTNQFTLYVKAVYYLTNYIKAFPDALVPGAPLGMKFKDSENFERVRLIAHPSVIEHDRGSMTPHLRRGHFATLRDDRYKRNEDGSYRVIFCKACVVGGMEAYHVTDDPEGEQE